MTTTFRHRLIGLGAGLLTVLLLGTATPASAVTPAAAFESIVSSPDGCQGVTISSITDSVGVRYYYRGKRLRFPTRELRFDRFGVLELTAKPKPGYTITQRRARLPAPESCFTDISQDTGLPRYQPAVSWCTTDVKPYLGQAFYDTTTSGEDVAASWQLVRRSNGQVEAGGHFTLHAGDEGETQFPVPAGLPRGRYVLTVRNDASAAALYPYSMAVEQYRCAAAPEVRRGAVTVGIPAGGPSANVSFWVASDDDDLETVVRVRAGHTYTFHTMARFVDYRIVPRGNHVGQLGAGSVEVPQS